MGEQCGFFEWADNTPQPSTGSRAVNPQVSYGSFGSTSSLGTTTALPDSGNRTAASAASSSKAAFVWPTAVRSNVGAGIVQAGAVRPPGSATFEKEDRGPAKRPRTEPAPTRLQIKLNDVQSVSLALRLTHPQPIKDAVQRFSGAAPAKEKNKFGEVLVTIPVERVCEFDTYIRAHAPVELVYEVPKSVLERIAKFQTEEKARERAGDIVTRPLDELLPTKLAESLMQFQWHGVHFALKRGGRCLIGDDMGLGKTIQAIAIARVYMSDWPLLIVCPSSLRLNWKEELLRWLGEDVDESDVHVVMSGKDVDKSVGKISIISYDLIRKVPLHTLKRFQFIIADESHYLKSTTAQRTKTVTPLVKQARRALLLSGTPALSRPVELFAQVNAICPVLFPSYNDYVVRYCNAKQSHWGFDVSGSSNLGELHTIMTETILIRRKKEEVLTQLPEKVRQVTWVETKASAMKSISKKMVEFDDAKAAAAEASTVEEANALGLRVKGIQNELYALAAEAKTQSVLDFCRDTAESGCKFIVFAHHAKMIDSLHDYIQNKLKLGLIRIDGNTPQGDRQGLCKKFQEDNDKHRVAVLSITAAGVGLTLTRASVVLFAELYWNPGTLLQAEDRAHRIGQRNCIVVNYLLAKKTLDESMWRAVRRKLTVVGQSLTGTAARMEAEEGKPTRPPSSSGGAQRKDAEPFFRPKTGNSKETNSKSKTSLDDKDDDVEFIGHCDAHVRDTSQTAEERAEEVRRSAKRKAQDELDAMFPSDEAKESSCFGEHKNNSHKSKESKLMKESYIDADMALARKLQEQYNAEMQ